LPGRTPTYEACKNHTAKTTLEKRRNWKSSQLIWPKPGKTRKPKQGKTGEPHYTITETTSQLCGPKRMRQKNTTVFTCCSVVHSVSKRIKLKINERCIETSTICQRRQRFKGKLDDSEQALNPKQSREQRRQTMPGCQVVSSAPTATLARPLGTWASS
jgi:hypothetical protein